MGEAKDWFLQGNSHHSQGYPFDPVDEGPFLLVWKSLFWLIPAHYGHRLPGSWAFFLHLKKAHGHSSQAKDKKLLHRVQRPTLSPGLEVHPVTFSALILWLISAAGESLPYCDGGESSPGVNTIAS